MSPHTDRTAAPARAMATPRRAAAAPSPDGIPPEALAPSVVGRLLAVLRREPVLWWTQPGRIEALPTANIARIESAPAQVAAPPATTPASAPAAIPASKTS